MEAKFQEFQFVEVDGTATGYGDLIGWIKSVELSDILGQPYYHIRVYSGHTETVYVAEKFVRETEIRPKIIERAKDCCECCGVKNHSLIHRFGKGINDWEYWPEGMESEAWSIDGKKPTKIILTIAHLDHDKLNHDVDLERLKALCQKCHLGYDLKHHISNRKYGRNHSDNNLKLDLY